MGAGGKHFTYDRNVGIFADFDGRPQTCQTSADNKDVILMLHNLPHVPVLDP
jgi:hypothetical protein